VGGLPHKRNPIAVVIAADDKAPGAIVGSLVSNRVISWNEEDITKYVSAPPKVAPKKAISPRL
jgi:hypothetical protein